MGWWDKIRGRVPTQEPPRSLSTPKDFGNFLVFSFLNKPRFGLDEEQLQSIVAKLPAPLQEPAKWWALFYLAWIYRMCVRVKHGDAFAAEMMNETEALWTKAEGLSSGLNDLGKAITFWIERTDSLTSKAGTEINGQVVPWEVFVALSFLILDHQSPYYNQNNTKMAEFEVAETLMLAKEKALPLIQLAVGYGAK